MRRSSRATKAPEVFKFDKITTTKNGLDDNDNDDDNNTTNDEDDDIDDEVIFTTKKRTSKKVTKKSNKKGKKVSDAINESDHDDDDDDNDRMETEANVKVKPTATKKATALKKGSNDLYDLISSNPSKKAIEDGIDKWINKYRINKIAALVINFVSSGAKKNWIDSDIDLDALDADEISELLYHMVVSLTKCDDESQYYPLSQSSKSSKVHGHYRD